MNARFERFTPTYPLVDIKELKGELENEEQKYKEIHDRSKKVEDEMNRRIGEILIQLYKDLSPAGISASLIDNAILIYKEFSPYKRQEDWDKPATYPYVIRINVVKRVKTHLTMHDMLLEETIGWTYHLVIGKCTEGLTKETREFYSIEFLTANPEFKKQMGNMIKFGTPASGNWRNYMRENYMLIER